MTGPFLGISYTIWGAICLALAVLFAVVWPVRLQTIAGNGGPRYLILRWGHALCWLLLAGSAFALGAEPADLRLAGLFGVAALGAYLVFVATLLAARS